MPGEEKFLTLLREALENIHEPRFFQDERGFQGALLQELSQRVAHAAFPGDPIIEQEYQKRLPLHKIRIRPDIIVHIPFERGVTEERHEDNFVAIELKRHATAQRAKEAFASLAQMKNKLKYPLTVFINIDAEETHAALCPKSIAGQTACFSVRLENGKPVVRWE